VWRGPGTDLDYSIPTDAGQTSEPVAAHLRDRHHLTDFFDGLDR
jgi:hypothetical protein